VDQLEPADAAEPVHRVLDVQDVLLPGVDVDVGVNVDVAEQRCLELRRGGHADDLAFCPRAARPGHCSWRIALAAVAGAAACMRARMRACASATRVKCYMYGI
jgi:hypothetical protein